MNYLILSLFGNLSANSQTEYPVNDIYGSIQGEGSMAGTPMVILRLQGCDVGCSFCDTKFTWDMHKKDEIKNGLSVLLPKLEQNNSWTKTSARDIADYIQSKFPKYKWVLVTGGEPATYELRSLVNELRKIGMKVGIETSGTREGHVSAGFDWVTVSPKIHKGYKKPMLPKAFSCADEIKMVIGNQGDVSNFVLLLTSLQKLKKDVIISLQPMSQSEKATQICIQAAEKHGWRISLQMHKYLELR